MLVLRAKESEHECFARANRFRCGVTRCSRTINPALSLSPYVPHSTQRNVNGLGGGREGRRRAGHAGCGHHFPHTFAAFAPSFTFSQGKVSRYKNYTLLGERSLNLVTRVGRLTLGKESGRKGGEVTSRFVSIQAKACAEDAAPMQCDMQQMRNLKWSRICPAGSVSNLQYLLIHQSCAKRIPAALHCRPASCRGPVGPHSTHLPDCTKCTSSFNGFTRDFLTI